MRSRKPMLIDRTLADWYKDAVIYQVHVKAYQDANGDGIGDFAGLMSRLDHIQSLGATAVWLLPFYPSPLRDDGYDISDYKAINPAYGSMADFRGFVAEAHARGLRVITELVINHTSDQHPWFQRARRAKRGSAARDFYVWSDDDQKWPETRIIFTDTEVSNWTWDPVAEQFYWHRFYSHQPDLNFDNPRVMQEVLKAMHFWLDMGVDGLRLDAIPYLVERDGTNNENLPETHAVLKAIRADLDAHYPDRMLLAEANQWPEDTRPYFGDGDECHMGFHFPLMPRMYMALAQEDRHPITDIIRQTPEIPEACQWGIFLRNHDELTLEMVTDKERDYLWNTYASDRRARINMGIRRRLAPLMQNDRRKIELLNSLLLSMPGTPILYYGDEIGMGDNYYLGDRDGVRTPMQWSSDRNGGFSRANPQQLYLPAIQDPVHGFQSVNVEAQSGDPSSLLNWMRRMVTVRQSLSVFGRGSMTLLYPSNRKVLAYVREWDGEAVLCVANLSRSAQAAEIDLAGWKGRVPVELSGQSPFPPVGDLPYLVTLPAWGFYWFRLSDAQQAPEWHRPIAQVLPEFLTLTTRDGTLLSALEGREGPDLVRDTLPRFLPLQRWFPAKDRPVARTALASLAVLGDRHILAALDVDGDRFLMPLSARWGEEHLAFGAPTLSATLAKLRRGPRMGALIDGTADSTMADTLIGALRDDLTFAGTDGPVRFRGTDALRALGEVGEPRLLSAEQSNASIAFGQEVILKIYRRLRHGVQPDVEIARHLTETARFAQTPAFLGAVEWQGDGDPATLMAAFAFVRNQGDAWGHLTEALFRDLQDHVLTETSETEEPEFAPPLDMARLLGTRTAELHAALAIGTDDPAFAPEPITSADLHRWSDEASTEVAAMWAALEDLPADLQPLVDRLRGLETRLQDRLRAPRDMAPSGARTRVHGDYHLGQILVVQNDVMIIDFEGEPGKPLAERRAKHCPLSDLAGLLRSLDYAAATALRHHAGLGADSDPARLRLDQWRSRSSADLLAAYDTAMGDHPTRPAPDLARALLDLFLIRKAAYEIGYERASRPGWADIPLSGLIDLLDRDIP
jgi:maltose alpha-D-glucosyltransferase / alpha-amylase